MKFNLLNYKNEVTEITTDTIKRVLYIYLTVLSGDETVKVYYVDGSIDKFDSAEDRVMSSFDGDYILYNPMLNIDLLHDTSWLNRKNSTEFINRDNK